MMHFLEKIFIGMLVVSSCGFNPPQNCTISSFLNITILFTWENANETCLGLPCKGHCYEILCAVKTVLWQYMIPLLPCIGSNHTKELRVEPFLQVSVDTNQSRSCKLSLKWKVL